MLILGILFVFFSP